MDSVSNPDASSPQTDQGCLDGALNLQFQIYSTTGPSGKFVNLNAVYQGGDLNTNSSEAGMSTVSGLATDF
jgi:hypothetical protein